MSENFKCTVKPSQWLNFGTSLLCFLLGFLILPLFYALWRYLVVNNWSFRITSERIIIKKGVFTVTTDNIELFRVKDIQLYEPFLLRIVKKSNIILITSDKTFPRFEIPAINDGNEISEMIRMVVDIRRDEKRVRETDFE